MWKGRFKSEPSSLLTLYGESISFDWRLYKQDIIGSIAHAKALERKGIINTEELKTIKDGLESIGKDIEQGTFEFDTSLEDIHMNIESALTERIGDTGAKLHTARSRNDQVSLDMRMYCKEEVSYLIGEVKNLQRSLINCCETFSEVVLPGYTHLQRGQPVLFAHHLLAYVEMLSRDTDRMSDAIKRIDDTPISEVEGPGNMPQGSSQNSAYPALLTDPQNNVHIAWLDFGNGSAGEEVLYTRLNATENTGPGETALDAWNATAVTSWSSFKLGPNQLSKPSNKWTLKLL